MLTQSVEMASAFLRDRGHIAVFIKDLQPNEDSTNLLHARIIEDIGGIPGLQYLGMKICRSGVNLTLTATRTPLSLTKFTNT